ncbi:permease [Pseudomonas aeruginosa]
MRVVGESESAGPTDFKSRLRRAGSAAFALFTTSLPYLLIGAGIGALIYGVVPGEWIATMAGADNPFAIPVAAAIGLPLYIRAETLIPIGMALQSQGMSIGAVAALIIAGAGASIPEVTLPQHDLPAPTGGSVRADHLHGCHQRGLRRQSAVHLKEKDHVREKRLYSAFV